VVEGAPLLRAYRGKTPIEGSNPSLSAKYQGPVGLFFRDAFTSRGTPIGEGAGHRIARMSHAAVGKGNEVN
jgi:hypothetical protein